MKNIYKENIYAFFIIPILFWAGIAYGESMSGAVYRLDSDSLNFAGDNSSSEFYTLDDTMGEISTGDTSSENYILSAGLQQTETSIMSISVTDTNMTLSPELGGLTGGYSDASTGVSIITDNIAGYALYIKSESSPSLQSAGDSLADYAPSGAVPDYDYIVAFGASNFGFSPEGPDIDTRYKDDGLDCGTGSLDSNDKCWDGLSSVQTLISGSGSRNNPLGATTTLKFRAGVGANRIQVAGFYYATTTITAIAL